jgi:hypothetical protein
VHTNLIVGQSPVNLASLRTDSHSLEKSILLSSHSTSRNNFPLTTLAAATLALSRFPFVVIPCQPAYLRYPPEDLQATLSFDRTVFGARLFTCLNASRDLNLGSKDFNLTTTATTRLHHDHLDSMSDIQNTTAQPAEASTEPVATSTTAQPEAPATSATAPVTESKPEVNGVPATEEAAAPITEDKKDEAAPLAAAAAVEEKPAEKTIEPITEGQLSVKGPGLIKYVARI